MTEPIAIGVDVGGTKIAITAADQHGTILSDITIDTQTYASEAAPEVIARIADSIEQSVQAVGRSVTGIGIAFPGPVDTKAGVLVNAANLGWKNIPVRDLLRSRLKLDTPIWVQNDVKAGILGELIFGAARDETDFVFLVIGTGLGGSAVVNGQIINGVNGWAMEVGHMSLNPQGRPCTCGNIGCAQMYVSGVGLLAEAAEIMTDKPEYENLTTHRILELAQQGDALAQTLIAQASEALGIVMAWCAMVLNPPLFVIGGGLGTAAYDLFIDGANHALRTRIPPDVYQAVRVVKADAQTSALGSAALVWHGLKAGFAAGA